MTGPAGERLRGLAALITLLAVVAGLPAVLYRLGGLPVPAHAPGWQQAGRVLLHRDNGRLFLAGVRDISWLAWAAAAVPARARAPAPAPARTDLPIPTSPG